MEILYLKCSANFTLISVKICYSIFFKLFLQTFPEELFSVLRTVQLLRGLAAGLGINYSCAEQWRSVAEEALHGRGRFYRYFF